MGKHVPKK